MLADVPFAMRLMPPAVDVLGMVILLFAMTFRLASVVYWLSE
jgi:hypothetical protein